ncbi:hypothetical protein K7472_12935 [Streptomyces sp. PTM05]|uniref:Uncharacterized protein n=1 Tax=Streptantibioticus parmotrematis TaxID=2873249 RepID=A0ABS7QTN4_9ACTN|nr:hypothetical protein [Streptantibioticus parmotrematis]MBY8885750.1 hypothetical protein [Streptantibioticus parmotrematis]
MVVYTENQIHKRIDQLLDDEDETLMRACESGPPGSVRKSISRYGDTMLNIYQLRMLIDELRALPEGLSSSTVKRLEEAAHAAIRSRGYLYFVGD